MELSRENVLEALGAIMEPDLKKDIVSANLVEKLEISENAIQLKVLVSNPAMHAKNE